MNPKADFYFAKNEKWLEELEQLRTFVLDCGLSEELRWGGPGYTFQERNILLLHVFKEYCAVLFFKGALLADAQGVLVQQTANAQAARQLRFATVGAKVPQLQKGGLLSVALQALADKWLVVGDEAAQGAGHGLSVRASRRSAS